MATGVYKITNKLNERIYIGSSLNIERRWVRHRYELRRNFHGNQFLQNDWNKCGEDNFEFEILETLSKEDIRIVEQQYLNKYYDNDSCYNLCPHVELDKAVLLNKQLKNKIKTSLRKKWENPEYKEKMRIAMKTSPFREIFRKFTSERMKKLWKNPDYANSVKIGIEKYQKTDKAKQNAKLVGERFKGNKHKAKKLINIIFIDPSGKKHIPKEDLYTFCKVNNLKYPTFYEVVFGRTKEKQKHQFKNGWIMIRL